MSNYKCVELGWIITDKCGVDAAFGSDFVEDPKALFAKFSEDDNGYPIPGSEHGRLQHMNDPCWSEGPLYLETHPHEPTIVFVAWTDLEHGFNDFTEPPLFGDMIRDAVGDRYTVSWGVIETER